MPAIVAPRMRRRARRVLKAAGVRTEGAEPSESALRPKRLRGWQLLLAAALLLAVVLGSVLLGAIDLGPSHVLGEVLAQLTGGVSPLSEREAAILWQLRVPRVLLACLVGAALAGAGAAYQGVFRNPLADPYLLGAAAGSGLAVSVTVVFSQNSLGWALAPTAFLGAIGGVALTWLLGRSAGAGTATLLLAGVAVAAFLTAVQTFVQQLNTETLQRIYTWMLGGLGSADWTVVLRVLPYVAGTSMVLCLCGRLLDVLSFGDEEARSPGIEPARVRIVVLGAASLATAAAVSASGLIGFVGIVVPHVVRLLVGTSYRVVLPLSLVCGAIFLVLADMAARTVLAPAELPIGVVTAFTGAPFFLVVLRGKGRYLG